MGMNRKREEQLGSQILIKYDWFKVNHFSPIFYKTVVLCRFEFSLALKTSETDST